MMLEHKNTISPYRYLVKWAHNPFAAVYAHYQGQPVREVLTLRKIQPNTEGIPQYLAWCFNWALDTSELVTISGTQPLLVVM